MAFYKGAAKEGQRAVLLAKQREKEKAELQLQKQKLEMEMRIGNIDNKFAKHYDAVEQQLKNDTVGLVTLDEMKAKQEAVISDREKQLAAEKKAEARLARQMAKEKKEAAKLLKNVLSFELEDEDVEEPVEVVEESVVANEVSDSCELKETPDFCTQDVPPFKRKRLGKNPNVDTSFLPDIDREEEERKLREDLGREWMQRQVALKEEDITITYSYWDGSGHRRQAVMKKGHTIAQFLQRCLEQCRKEFPELRTSSHDQLMYIKEDLIIPQHYTFYDFIVTKARGKSGPLFVFDVHEDVRVRSDATVAKDESHAGKVCLRSWYERNKHIFPASRWEPYDPHKNWDEYSISDKMSAKILVK